MVTDGEIVSTTLLSTVNLFVALFVRLSDVSHAQTMVAKLAAGRVS